MFLYILMIFIWTIILCFFAYLYYKDYKNKMFGKIVYNKKYKRIVRYYYKNDKYVPEYILKGEKIEDF